ncbi:hypothetical protein [Devosia sp. DBB001]|nr:hypothetical protein [Devosia sp. DBB001]
MTDISSVRGAVDGDIMWRHLEEFAKYEKEAGTPGELESLRYCEDVMRSYGYRTELLSHEAYISLPKPGASVKVGGVEVGAITHSFSRSAPAGGLKGKVVDVGKGMPDDYKGKDVRGKIVLMDGIANPVVTMIACRMGAIGQIHVSPSEQRHEMCISPVWGSPDDRKAKNLPTSVVCTVRESDGAKLREELAKNGAADGVLVADVDTGWRPTPILVADMSSSAGGDEEPFVFYTGHHDTWYYGVMDNGGANATMIEVARIAALHRDQWKRALRVVFWSGHSQGRYSSSSWYADHNWEELQRRALVHVNVDSTGGKNNTVVADTAAAAELRGLASEAIREVSGQTFGNARMARAGDQSFWGMGVPAIFGNMSTHPVDAAPAANGPVAMFRPGKSGGFGTGWWWHTPDDLIEQMDNDILVRDTQIYMHTVWRLLTDAALPLDYAEHGRYLSEELASLQTAVGARFDLSELQRRAEKLVALASALPPDADPMLVNGILFKVSRALVPVDYTDCDAFDHDPALPMRAYPSLQSVRDLPTLPTGSDEEKFMTTRLVRARNRVAVALAAACAALEEGLAELKKGKSQ